MLLLGSTNTEGMYEVYQKFDLTPELARERPILIGAILEAPKGAIFVHNSVNANLDISEIEDLLRFMKFVKEYKEKHK